MISFRIALPTKPNDTAAHATFKTRTPKLEFGCQMLGRRTSG
jgi:hypothetical protein